MAFKQEHEPSSKLVRPEMGVARGTVRFESEDGTGLVGVLNIRSRKKCVILCHGITGSMEDEYIRGLENRLVKRGISTFRFDFRGHGKSGGEQEGMTISGEKGDLEAAFDFLVDRGYESFGVVAASFAGGAVSYFLPNHQESVKAIVLWAGLIDYRNSFQIKDLDDEGRQMLKDKGYVEFGDRGFKLGSGAFNEMNGPKRLRPWAELEKVNTQILFLHGDNDQVAQYDDAKRYAERFKTHAELVTVKGAKHGFEGSDEIFAEEKATDFLVAKLSK